MYMYVCLCRPSDTPVVKETVVDDIVSFNLKASPEYFPNVPLASLKHFHTYHSLFPDRKIAE